MSKQIFPYGTGSTASVHITSASNDVSWRLYVISPVDGLIHELAMSDARSLNYTERAFNIGPRPLPGSPIAAVAWNQSDEASTSIKGSRRSTNDLTDPDPHLLFHFRLQGARVGVYGP